MPRSSGKTRFTQQFGVEPVDDVEQGRHELTPLRLSDPMHQMVIDRKLRTR
jgi:hypothetical protein